MKIRERLSYEKAGVTPFTPPVSYKEADARARQLLEQMTAEEKYDVVCGGGLVINGNERLGIPTILLFDATQGVHLRPQYPAGALSKTVSFPCAQQLAATWNRVLAAQYATAVGQECRAGGIHVILGPGMNIYRIAQCGRNFEYMGEDPHLAGEMIKVYVTVMQQQGVIATLKHFVGNNTDFCRRSSNSLIPKRALEEIYMPAFKAGIEAGGLAVMTSYNLLHGEYCGQSNAVINGLLRQRLGFKHLVMTDWLSVTDGQKVADSGQDLEMPFGVTLQAARESLLGSSKIDRIVLSVLRSCIMMGFYDRSQELPELLDTFAEHEQVAYQTAAEGIVLLRNEQILPLSPTPAGKILITGNFAGRIPLAGKGSGHVEGYDNVSFADAIARKIGDENVIYRTRPDAEEIQRAETVIVCVGFEFEGERYDRSFAFPEAVNTQIEQLTSLNSRVIVVLNTGGAVKMEWHDKTAAIIQAMFCGQKGANALADILFGDICPSGKLPYTFEKDFNDSPDPDYVPAGGDVNSELRTPKPGMPKPDQIQGEWPYPIHYREGVFVGYRWYDQQNKEPWFWFGHGLSYTTFEYSNVRIQPLDERTWEIRVTITNTGSYDGAEVAQLYVGPPPSTIVRPKRELKGFDKVFLEQGAAQDAVFVIDTDDFKYFDETTDIWTLLPGTYTLSIGSSYNDIRVTSEIEVPS